jgi:hypothetical protein
MPPNLLHLVKISNNKIAIVISLVQLNYNLNTRGNGFSKTKTKIRLPDNSVDEKPAENVEEDKDELPNGGTQADVRHHHVRCTE